jgi:hypothetical protein
MSTDVILIVLVVVCIAVAGAVGIVLFRQSDGPDSGSASEMPDDVPARTAVPEDPLPEKTFGTAEAFRMHPAEDRSIRGDVVMLDEQARALMSMGKMREAPAENLAIDDVDGVARRLAGQLAVDVIARSMNVNNETIELVFDAQLAARLAVGKIEMVKVRRGDGQRMVRGEADPRRFAHHGHQLEAGRRQQIGLGVAELYAEVLRQAHKQRQAHAAGHMAIRFDAVSRVERIYLPGASAS